MDLAEQTNLTGGITLQSAGLEAADGEHRRGSDPALKTSPEAEASTDPDGDVEPYGKGDYDKSSQGIHDGAYPAAPESAQDTSELSEKVERSEKGGVEGWLSSRLGGSKSDHKHEDQALGYGQGSYSGEEMGGELGNHSGTSELTTDSGEAVRSISDGPVKKKTFNISPMKESVDAENAQTNIDTSEFQGL